MTHDSEPKASVVTHDRHCTRYEVQRKEVLKTMIPAPYTNSINPMIPMMAMRTEKRKISARAMFMAGVAV